jgi:hypothetical protein
VRGGWIVAAGVSLIACVFGVLTAQAGYRQQVSYVSELCRAEAQLFVYRNHGDPTGVTCTLEFWDGGQTSFDVAGGPAFLRFWCSVNELDFFEKPDRCELSAP